MGKGIKLPVGNGSTGKEKAVKKAGGSESVKASIDGPDTIKVSDEYEARERRYRAEEAARTLARAEEIRKDKALMKDVKGHIKNLTKACS